MSYDPAKRKLNLRKHGVDLAKCDGVFDEPMLTRETIGKRMASSGLSAWDGSMAELSFGVDGSRRRATPDFM
jgi:hypothetical protein